MVFDVGMVLLFWAMVLGPCMIAMNVDLDRRVDEEEDRMTAGLREEVHPRSPAGLRPLG